MQVTYQKDAIKTVRSAAILTNNYVLGTTLGLVNSTVNNPAPADITLQDYNELVLYCYFTLGSLTSAQIKVESSLDGTNWVTETNMTVSGATVALNKGEFSIAEDGNFKIAMPISAHFVRVSAKGTGTVTSSSLAIDAYLLFI